MLQRLRLRLGELHDDNLGIDVVELSLLDLHPPAEVVSEYYEVAKAMENRDQKINLARKDALLKKKTAEAEGNKIIAQAQAYGAEKVSEARSEQVRFLAESAGRRKLSAVDEVRLRMDSIDAVLRGEEPATMAGFERRRREKLAVQASLVDFRIFWDRVSRGLVGRDLVLIDADKVRGQRTFMLLDPDTLRPPPVLLPTRPPARQDDD